MRQQKGNGRIIFAARNTVGFSFKLAEEIEEMLTETEK